MIVLDASVLIAYLDARDQHHDAAEQLLLQSADDEFGANALTVAEVLVGPLRAGHLDVARSALDELGVRELAFPVDTAVPLARLRAVTGLRMPDCGVLLAAEGNHARVASFDARLVRAAEQHGLQVLGV